MGTWDTGIFDNDLAGDIRDAFEDALSSGLDVPAATRSVLSRFPTALADVDDRPVIYLALAALQLEHSALQQDIREQALQIIDTGEGLDVWEEAGPDTLRERVEVLESFRAQLSQ